MNKNKVIILTHPLFSNYGGLMQAYALQKVVRDWGFDVVTASGSAIKPSWKRIYTWLYLPLRQFWMKRTGQWQEQQRQKQIRNKYTSAFIDKHIRTVNFFQGKSVPSKSMANAFDTYIVGSDQVWRKQYMNLRTYFLGFLRNDGRKHKIAYAASFGVDNLNDWTQDELKDCRQLIQQFSSVSVREEQGLDLCKRLLGREAVWVLDPTMLLQREQYIELIPNTIKATESKVFCYFLDKDARKTAIAANIGKQLGVGVHHHLPDKFDRLRYGRHDGYSFPPVEDWLAGFRDASFVVTDSFHGTVFSILFGKPFICIGNRERGSARFTSLLKQFNLERRIISADTEITPDMLTPIDYAPVYKHLENLRKQSMTFLHDALQLSN